MEQSLDKIKNFFTLSKNGGTSCGDVEPQIGFKVTFNETTKQLKVKVIGARQLPTVYGNSKPFGYLVKVTVFPQKEKYSTTPVKESWPVWNEEFTFNLNPTLRKHEDYFKGKFISFTVYADLQSVKEESESKPRSTLKRFLSFDESDKSLLRTKTKPSRRSFRQSLSNRRTVGAATYNLDSKMFTQKVSENTVGTPDIWRGIKEILSGVPTESREGKKGTVEVTLCYSLSEDGTNDVVEVSVTKFRCSVQTMQEHEKIGGQMYIKINAFEQEDVTQKMKSDRFEPTISLKMEKTTALRATVNKYNLDHVKILIRLISRNLVGKKTLLGKIEIDKKSDIWREIVASPSVPVTRVLHFQ